jgi:drug/metabolite transporter (DMT)-like permease
MGLFAGLLFGVATPFSKIILSQFNSFQMAGFLYIGAAAAYLHFIIKNRKTEYAAVKKSRAKKYLLSVIITGGILGPLFLMLALRAANAMSVSIWLNLELVATAVLGIVFFKDHLDRYAVIGVLLTLCAGVLTSIHESGSGLFSGFFILLACIAWGIDNHFTAIIDGIKPQTITFIKGLFGGITNLSIGLFLSRGELPFSYIPAALIIGVFSYGISIVLYVVSAQNLGATRSQILFSTSPFWGIITAFIFLGEPIGIMIVISIILLALGIFFTSIGSHEHEHKHFRTTHIHLHTHDADHHNHYHINIDDDDNSTRHSHIHDHDDKTHTHKHFPDIHHRHKH